MVEVEYRQLESRLSSSKSFETIERAHSDYLNSILTHTFTHLKAIVRTLDDIFLVAWRLYTFIEINTSSRTPIDLAAGETEVSGLYSAFEESTLYLVDILGGIKAGGHVSPFLGQLLLRLDFNKFWSSLHS